MELIYGERFPSRELMRRAVFKYIEVDNNQTRRHSTNGYLSLMVFEAQRAVYHLVDRINVLLPDAGRGACVIPPYAGLSMLF